MKKKWIIAGISVFGVIGLLLLLSFTLFSLNSVSVDFRTSRENLTATEEEIIDAGKFNYSNSVFFHGKKGAIYNIEKAQPYIKVINIETVFPSSFVIHIAERQETYSIEHNSKFYICDDELRVLKIVDEFVSTRQNSILLKGLEVKNENILPGDYLEIDGYINIYSSFYESNLSLGEQTALIKEIEFKTEHDENIKKDELCAYLKAYNGQVYKLKNCEYGLKYKVKLMLQVYSQVYTYIGKELEVKDENGAIIKIILTKEILDNSQIVISNYYDYTSHDESECYFNIIPMQA